MHEIDPTSRPDLSWNFGYYPSDLIENEDLKYLDANVIERADRLFARSLRMTRGPMPEICGLVKEEMELRDKVIIRMAAYGAKSGGCVYPKEPKRLESLLEGFGLQCFSERMRSSNGLDSKRGYSSKIIHSYFFSKDPGFMIETMKFILNPSYTILHRQFIQGIFFGYPLGDIIGFTRLGHKGHSPYLVFCGWKALTGYTGPLSSYPCVPTPTAWPRKWRDSVGIGGEELFRKIYLCHARRFFSDIK